MDALADMFPGINPYQYAYNNPVMFSDPSGLIVTPGYTALSAFGLVIAQTPVTVGQVVAQQIGMSFLAAGSIQMASSMGCCGGSGGANANPEYNNPDKPAAAQGAPASNAQPYIPIDQVNPWAMAKLGKPMPKANFTFKEGLKNTLTLGGIFGGALLAPAAYPVLQAVGVRLMSYFAANPEVATKVGTTAAGATAAAAGYDGQLPGEGDDAVRGIRGVSRIAKGELPRLAVEEAVDMMGGTVSYTNGHLVDFLANKAINGGTLELTDIAFYPRGVPGNELKNAFGPRQMLETFEALKQYAKDQGFTKLRIHFQRAPNSSSAKPSKVFDEIFNL